jgi:hypothetical protein
MIKDLKPLIGKLAKFAKYRMGFSHPPKLFLKQDNENAKSCLGRTAHYDPDEKSITIFVTGRHPKDVLRSLAHELVHHTQNLRGDLSPEKCGDMSDKYAQENPHMRKMEEEAYLVGNMCFRDWEDNEKFSLQESKLLKENKKMTKKITKESLKEMIRSILERKLQEAHPGSQEEKERSVSAAGDGGPTPVEEPKTDESPVDLSVVTTPDKLIDIVRAVMSKLEDHLGLGDIEEKTKRDGHQIVGRPVPDDRIKPLEEEDGEEEMECDGGQRWSDEESKCVPFDMQSEGNIYTPERETSLYESRFAKRNTRLFEGLVKKWTK